MSQAATITVNAGTDNEFEVEAQSVETGNAAEWFAAALQERFGDDEIVANGASPVVKHVYYADKPGPKFTRIVHRNYGERLVHAFVENATGAVFKAEGWKRPAKGVRFASVEAAVAAVDAEGDRARFGGYLYR